MWCMKCDKDLVDCICPDLKARLERLRKCPHIHAPSVIDKNLVMNKLKKEQPKPEDQ